MVAFAKTIQVYLGNTPQVHIHRMVSKSY